MYHYVRDPANTRFPLLKALRPQRFVAQLDYLEAQFRIVTADDVIAARFRRGGLPENAAILTFDDGYREHAETVAPELRRRGLQGLFFPPAEAIRERRVLDVNKIQLLLAMPNGIEALAARIDDAVRSAVPHAGLETVDAYRQRLARADDYDPADVVYAKHMLQYALPEEFRRALVDRLFREAVAEDERTIADALYMSAADVHRLVRSGMYVGSHGYGHYWLDRLSPAQQEEEVVRSLGFLHESGAATRDWIMCYPYGAHNTTLHGILERHDCALGLTTRPGVANLALDHPLQLPRVDTIHLPPS